MYDPHLHHRRSIRLKGYDYSQPGAYFITLVTYQRDCLFGSVIDGEMQLSPLGKIAQDEWMRSIGIRKEITIHEDEFVIMPNHFHGIVWIVGADGVRPDNHVQGLDSVRPDNRVQGLDGVRPDNRVQGSDGVRPDNRVQGSDGVRPDNRVQGSDGARPSDRLRPNDNFRPNDGTGAYHAPLRRKPRSLSSFVAGFKAAVTSRANHELNMNGIWQRNYYDHIIRDDQDFMNIWNYIDTNPQGWKEDQLHPFTTINLFNQD